MKEVKFSEDEWAIVTERVHAMPAHLRMSIGGTSLTKEELLEHLKKRDEIGALLVKIHLNYLRSFKQEAAVLG